MTLRSIALCFARSYVAGTEDGNIHKCSCSYNEQYLGESFCGHTGPVYQIQWSPFASNLFLSASADWTMKLWQEDRDSAVLSFQSTNSGIADVRWSPNNATVFGCVTEDGRLQIWDMSVSTLKPVLTQNLQGQKLSCLLFSKASPVVVCGSNTGEVGVYRLVGVGSQDHLSMEDVAKQKEKLEYCCKSSQKRANV